MGKAVGCRRSRLRGSRHGCRGPAKCAVSSWCERQSASWVSSVCSHTAAPARMGVLFRSRGLSPPGRRGLFSLGSHQPSRTLNKTLTDEGHVPKRTHGSQHRRSSRLPSYATVFTERLPCVRLGSPPQGQIRQRSLPWGRLCSTGAGAGMSEGQETRGIASCARRCKVL